MSDQQGGGQQLGLAMATTARENVAVGRCVVTPNAMTGILPGTYVEVANADGSNGEVVKVVVTTGDTFSADFTLPKTGPGITISWRVYNFARDRANPMTEGEMTHAIPIGELVELSDGVRLWVVCHIQDRGGSPLYYLSADRDDTSRREANYKNPSWVGRYGEGSLQRPPTMIGFKRQAMVPA